MTYGVEGLEGEEEEEDAQAEIDKILLEITAGALGAAPDALKGTNLIYAGASYNYKDCAAVSSTNKQGGNLF